MEIIPREVKILIDDEDWNKIKDYDWHISPAGYVEATAGYGRKRRNYKMHRIIMNAKKGQIIDHKNGIKHDNRKENLRFCTISQNMANRPNRRDNECGFKGVSKRLYGGKHGIIKYHAEIKKDSIYHNLGTFNSAEEAALAYNIKAKELFGEFAFLNNVPKNTIITPYIIERTKAPYYGVRSNFKGGQRFQACITLWNNGNRSYKYLGTFKTEKEAAQAYNEAAIKYGSNKRNIV